MKLHLNYRTILRKWRSANAIFAALCAVLVASLGVLAAWFTLEAKRAEALKVSREVSVTEVPKKIQIETDGIKIEITPNSK